ncbi:hypothetical protein ACH429_17905 [Streptomyces pathocidini]|uniref:Uncharacterized protein n=1 Tax=Streptomyces pathocidini TaxID=1650571 RepID=A0ABW7UVX2_9ACTN
MSAMSNALLSRAVGAARRARTTAVRVRGRVERMDTVPVLGNGGRPRPLLRPEHLSVLGGRTLNLAVPFPRTTRSLAAARLELRHGGRLVALPLEQEARPGGGPLLTATAPLDYADAPAPEGRALSEGLWRMAVVVTDGAGRERRAALAAPAPRTTAGPTLAHPPHPATGAVLRPVRSVDGHALLKVAAPRHQAELTGLDLRWDRITVHGRLVGGPPPRVPYAAEAVRRQKGASGRTVAAAPAWDGGAFTFDLPLAAMAAGERGQRTWDVQLRSGRSRLRVGRRLTDIRSPKRVFRTPYRVVALDGGELLRVHAHFTPAGALSVTCAAVADTARTTPAAAAATAGRTGTDEDA